MRNARARASILAGLLAIAVAPVAIATSRLSEVTLVQSAAAIPAAALLGLLALLLARGARRTIQRTLGRAGGAGAARFGHALGVLGVGLGLCGALALGFFGLLTLVAS